MKKHGLKEKDAQRSEAHSGSSAASTGKKASHQDQHTRNSKDEQKQAKKAPGK